MSAFAEDESELPFPTFEEADAEVTREINKLVKLAEEERAENGPLLNTKAFNIATWRRIGLEDAQRIYRQVSRKQ